MPEHYISALLYVYLTGKVTAASWQVTLFDLMLHVIARSGVVFTNCYIRFTYLLIYLVRTYERFSLRENILELLKCCACNC